MTSLKQFKRSGERHDCNHTVSECQASKHIYPSTFLLLIWGRGGNRFRRETQTSLSPATLLFLLGLSEAFTGQKGHQYPFSIFWFCLMASPQLNVPKKTSRERHPGSRCSNHLIWLLSIRRSSSSVLSSPLNARVSHHVFEADPSHPPRKLFPAACIQDLILSIATQI